MRRSTALARQRATDNRLDEIEARLVEIARAFDLPGIRHQKLGLFYNGERTRMMLDRKKLIENGVSSELIKACYSQSKPFVDARFISYG